MSVLTKVAKQQDKFDWGEKGGKKHDLYFIIFLSFFFDQIFSNSLLGVGEVAHNLTIYLSIYIYT